MNGVGALQQFGRAIMLPTMVLPVAAIMLSLGHLPWEHAGMPAIGNVLVVAGQTIFTFLPYFFAVGVALGMANNTGTAGIAALLGIFIYQQMMEQVAHIDSHPPNLVGVIFGVIAGSVHNRYKDLKLPEYIQFFGGPRFVLLFMGIASVFISFLMMWLFPHLQAGVQALGDLLLASGGIGVFLFGVFQRILVVFGLHHLLNYVMFFEVGTYDNGSGDVIRGDLMRFFAGDPSAGQFMTGLYPMMMFAIPAIAFAIIHESREDLRPKIRKTFLTAAFVSFLTGITEPIEFAFMFVAPYLFVIHALLSGFVMWLTYSLDIHHGFSFSAGAIDYVLNGYLAKNGLLLIPIGLCLGLAYYFLFRFVIRKFQIPTPGREEGSVLDDWAGSLPYRAPLILQALGGKENIVRLEACVTRLRLTVVDDRKLDRNALRLLGAAGMIRLGGGNIQVVFGTYSEIIRAEIEKLMRKKVNQVLFNAPVQGRMIPLEDVPDQIFARKLVGNGVAFIPDRGEIVAPVAGRIMTVYPTKHAIGIETPEGLNVLIHLGIDTSELNGKGITVSAREGDEVAPGQLLMKFDLAYIRKHCASLATPMVITNPERVKSWSFAPFKAVKKGQASVMSVVINDSDVGGGTQ